MVAESVLACRMLACRSVAFGSMVAGEFKGAAPLAARPPRLCSGAPRPHGPFDLVLVPRFPEGARQFVVAG